MFEIKTFQKQEQTESAEEVKLTNKEQKELIEAEEAYREGLVFIRDLIAPASMRVSPYYLELNNKFVRTIFVIDYPRYISVGWFSSIINLSAPLDIAMFFYKAETAVILKQLRNKVGVLEAEMSSEIEKGAPRDPIKETALRDMEKLRDDLTQGIEHFFQFALYVTIYADSKEELDTLSERVELLFGSKLVYSRRSFYQSEQGFNSTLPLANDELMVTFNMNTSPCATSFPFSSADITSDNGVLYGINRHNNSLILFDRFSLENANMTVFAVPGAGKSVAGFEPVLIRDKNKSIRMVKIGELIEKIGQKQDFQPIDKEMEGVVDPGIEVYSFDRNFKGKWSKVTIAARKIAPHTLYQFKTASGREITTTGDHNMLILKDGEIIAAKSEDVKNGEYLPLPREISEAKDSVNFFNLLSLLKNSYKIYLKGGEKIINDNYQILSRAKINPKLDKYLYKYRQGRPVSLAYFHQILAYLKTELKEELIKNMKICSCKGRGFPAIWKITPEFLRLLGYIVSEGTIGNKFILISNQDLEVKQDIKKCFEKLGISYYLQDQDTFASRGRVFVELMKVLKVTGKSKEKRVPPFIFNLAKKKIAEFLKAYFEGDGGVENHSLSAVSKSPQLVSDISYILFYFGIISRISKKKKKAQSMKLKKNYYFLSLSGQENLKKFARNINFISQRKKQKLSRIIKKKGNTNVDVIPDIQNIFREIYQLFSFQLYGIREVSYFKDGCCNPSPERLRKVVRKIEERVKNFKELGNKFKILETLPCLADVINLGKTDKNLNRNLWQDLGQNWRLMKNQEVNSRANNVFKAIEVVSGNSYSAEEVKSLIHSGFKEMGLSVKRHNCYLQTVLVAQRQSNTNYNLIQKSAQFIWQNYQRILDNIPQIEKRLGQLKRLAKADLFWDPITEIKKIRNKDLYVYDLTVDDEVFLAGRSGLFIHNSYFVKLEVLRSLMFGSDVIIIDPEREYEHLCDAVGGSYINISLASESKINPFDLPRPISKDFKTGDIIRSAVITLKGLLKLMIGSPNEKGALFFTPEEDSLLDRALIETYAKKDITPDSDLASAEPPIMSDLLDVLEGMEGGEGLAERLKKYTEGTFSGLLNQPTNIETKNQLVVFSVRDLEDELRPIAIYTIINYIWNIVRSELKKRILVVDEGWWLMQHEDSAKFIFALVKRCRKYYLGVTMITQDVQDFLSSEYGHAIINNSALRILFKQSPSAIELITKTFMLTEGEKYLLLECGPGEGIFFAGVKHAAIKVVASYTEDQLITSDPRQLLEIAEAKKEFEEEMKKEE